MKIRTGFVSNSSSSSFIVSTSGTTKITLPIEVDLAKFGNIIKSKKELDDYYVDYYMMSIEELLGDEDEDYVADKYRACLKAIKAGKTVIVGSFSNEGDGGIEEFLYETGLCNVTSKGIDIIEKGNKI